jgi:5-(carboxyamino)imidazole ribonucleotide mutase
MSKPLVGIIMGSDSVSAHRTPKRLVKYSENAEKRGLRVIIAGAGGAAHLPGMVASLTPLPVIGVPVKGSSLEGMDSLLSIVQMPGGVPVATVAINGAKNAGILAAQILGVKSKDTRKKIKEYKEKMLDEVQTKIDKLEDVKYEQYLKTM